MPLCPQPGFLRGAPGMTSRPAPRSRVTKTALLTIRPSRLQSIPVRYALCVAGRPAKFQWSILFPNCMLAARASNAKWHRGLYPQSHPAYHICSYLKRTFLIMNEKTKHFVTTFDRINLSGNSKMNTNPNLEFALRLADWPQSIRHLVETIRTILRLMEISILWYDMSPIRIGSA